MDWIGGALRPAPTRSDSAGRPLALTVSPPVIVGRPATDQTMGALAVAPDESVAVIVAVALPVRVGLPEIRPVAGATERPEGRPVAW